MKKIIVFFLIFNCIFLSGCWDMIEINERAFPYTVGFDINPQGEEKFIVTFSHPNINAIGDQALEEDLIHIIVSPGNSMFDATEQLSRELFQPFTFKHLKVIVISNQVAQNKQLLLEILDGVQRDFMTNNNANLLITDSAQDLLEYTVDATIQHAIEGTIYSILKNNQDSVFFTPVSASQFIRNMDQTGAAIIPLATYEENIRISGGSIFKAYEYVGDISSEENRAIAILNNEVDSLKIDVEHQGYVLSLMITESKARKRLEDSSNNNLKIDYQIELEGHIHSHILDEEHQVDNQEILEELEKIAEELVKEHLDKTVKKLQSEYNSDVLFISDYLNKFHPNLWENLEDDYDEVFPHMDIETSVDLNIRRRGLIK